MKLGKLLFAGKSIAGGCGNVSYREDKRVALPKFISPKNPFAPAKKPAEISPAPVKSETAPAPAVTRNAMPAKGGSKSLSAWTAKLNPASLWSGASPAVQKTLPAVQAELSLDTVKVVHNDLSDADVEVVPIKSRPAAALSELPTAKKSWEILGERLLRATTL